MDVTMPDLMEKPKEQQYYFGNLDEHRVASKFGRDFTLAPKQAAGRERGNPNGRQRQR